MISCYEKLDASIRNNGRLKFCYINSLHKLGRDEEAYGLLMEDGGLVIDDIREGEDSVAQLWADIGKAIGKDNTEVPYIFDSRHSENTAAHILLMPDQAFQHMSSSHADIISEVMEGRHSL